MKKIYVMFIIMISFFTINVKANSIKSIDMDVYLSSNGDAHVVEVWKTSLSEGTEGYKVFSNLGDKQIKNFKVHDGSRWYDSVDNWNSNRSFIEKAYKSGIKYTNAGLELCFGISNYGNMTYKLEYDITSLVTDYQGIQGIYFDFINLDTNVGKAKIKIHADYEFKKDINVSTWAFGFKGKINIDNDTITFETKSKLKSDDYMVVLVKFMESPFNTLGRSNLTFDELYQMSMNGVKKEFQLPDIKIIIGIAIGVLVLLGITRKKDIFDRSNTPKEMGNLYFDGGHKLPMEVEDFRDIPCNNDVFYAYFLSYYFGISKESTIKSGILGALLLKWYKEGIIKVNKSEEILNLEEYTISFTSIKPKTGMEMSFYSMLHEASQENEILESNEFKAWCKNNKERIKAWYDVLISNICKDLENEGIISKIGDEYTDSLGNSKKAYFRHVGLNVNDEATKLAGLKQYLYSSSINEKTNQNVYLWDYYLIYAYLFGIADKVRKEFSKISTDVNQYLFNDIDFDYIDDFSRSMTIYSDYSTYHSDRSSSFSSSDSSFSSGGSDSGGSSGGGFR